MTMQHQTNMVPKRGPLSEVDPEAFKALARLIAYEDMHASQGNYFGISDEELHFTQGNNL